MTAHTDTQAPDALTPAPEEVVTGAVGIVAETLPTPTPYPDDDPDPEQDEEEDAP